MISNQLRKLSSKVYYLPPGKNDRPVLGIIIGSNASLIVDAGNSPAHAKKFLKIIESELPHITPIKYVVITHWHWDHHFGLVELDEITSIAHQKTVEELKILNTYRWEDSALQERQHDGVEIPFNIDNIKGEFPSSNRHIEIAIPKLSFKQSLVIDLGDIQVNLR